MSRLACEAAFAIETRIARQTITEISAGRFTFIERTVEFPADIDWHISTVDRLWRYHLHYFVWVPALCLGEAAIGYHVFRRQALSWIAGNRMLRGDGWHPYTISLRTVHWMQAWAQWRSELASDTGFRRLLADSLHTQLRLLERQVEFDVRGNHLLENMRALWWGGIFFSGPAAERWREVAKKIAREEIAEQVLADGAHFERTPGYHVTMLALWCDVAILLRRNGEVPPDYLLPAVHRMARFLVAIQAPDGRLPLLKDTAYDALPPRSDLLHVAAILTADATLRPAGSAGLWARRLVDSLPAQVPSEIPRCPPPERVVPQPEASGYFVARGTRGDFLMIDCGRPCPDYLPAHAHADSLSYEFHAGGVPLVVDSGVFEYTAGAWRDFFRSTRAHNTVEVNGRDSSEVWSSFRVGRRARVQVRGYGQLRDATFLIASHDGYRCLRPAVRHDRCFIWVDDEFLVILDWVHGTGKAEVASYVHIHPDVELRPGPDDLQLRHRAGSTVSFRPITAAMPQIEWGTTTPRMQGWYSERFGEKTPNKVLKLSAQVKLPHAFGYLIAREVMAAPSLNVLPDGVELTMAASGEARIFHWSIAAGTLTA